jgi:hypothetical protein
LASKEKYLDKKQTNSNRSKNECHPNPDFAADGHFAFVNQIIAEGDTDEYDGDGNENNSY